MITRSDYPRLGISRRDVAKKKDLSRMCSKQLAGEFRRDAALGRLGGVGSPSSLGVISACAEVTTANTTDGQLKQKLTCALVVLRPQLWIKVWTGLLCPQASVPGFSLCALVVVPRSVCNLCLISFCTD